MKSLYWADQWADKVIKAHKVKIYIVECGVTPSGRKHIGNYREIITNGLIAKALEDKGKKVIFQLGWDDYDNLRKIPADLEGGEDLKKHLGEPVKEVPYKRTNYADYFEKILVKEIKDTGLNPKLISNYNLYKTGKFAELMRILMRQRKQVAEILNRSREEPYPEKWYPLTAYCEKCNKDSTEITNYNEDYEVTYECRCGYKNTIDFEKKGIVKPIYRADWAMRWAYFGVNFEAAGKDHMVKGSSFDRASDIVREVFHKNPPLGTMYDFVNLKGIGGKMSASKGNVLTVEEVLQVYILEVLRYQFAGTKPQKEFVIPMDDEFIKVYEDFYKCERIYFNKEKVSERDKAHWSRVYEMSCIKLPKTLPVQLAIRTCIEFVNIFQTPEKAAERYAEFMKIKKSERLLDIMKCVKNWLEKYASEQYKFELQESPTAEGLSSQQKAAIRDLAASLSKKLNEKQLFEEFYKIAEKNGLKGPQFFQAAYKLLLNKDRGPRLAPFILAVGREKIAKLLKQSLS